MQSLRSSLFSAWSTRLPQAMAVSPLVLTAAPDINTQCEQIRPLWEAKVKEGENRYLLGKKWMNDWLKYVQYPKPDDQFVSLICPGPVDNSHLLQPESTSIHMPNDWWIAADTTGLFISLNACRLRENLKENTDYVHLPTEAWNLLVKWYGMTPGSTPIVRASVTKPGFVLPWTKKIVAKAMSAKQKILIMEIYPPEFNLKFRSSQFAQLPVNGIAFSETTPVGECLSYHKTVSADHNPPEFVERVMRIFFEIDQYIECQLWADYGQQGFKLLADPDQTLKDIKSRDITIVKKNSDGTWPKIRVPECRVLTVSIFQQSKLDVFAILRGEPTPVVEEESIVQQEIVVPHQEVTPASSRVLKIPQQPTTQAEQRIRGFERQLEEMQRQAESQNRGLQQSLDAAQQQARLARQEVEEARQEVAQGRWQIVQTQQQAEEARQQADEARQQTAQARQQAGEYRRQAEGARQQAVQAREQVEDYRQQTTQARQQINEARQQAEEARRQVEEARQQAEEAHHRADEMERDLRDAERRISTSDQVFQDVLHRIMGHIPQSQPFWVVQGAEVTLTEEIIGTGGWASVKVAIFRGQRVAAKCLHQQIVSAHNIRLFTREMNMAAQARHPNLLQFVGAVMEGTPIVLTELLPTSLRRIMEEGTRLTRQQIVSISCDVARALNYLHLSTPDPIVHRDLSSANVLLDPHNDSWKAKVSDYGSANFVRYATTAGPGNPLYGAPEAGDPSRHSPKMDVFSFGVLLVEMVAGELPDNREELIQTRMNDWPELVRIVRGCTCREPQRRPDMNQLIADLTGLNVD